MECFEKGVFTTKETDGLDLTWGNVEAVKTLMNRIARREGLSGQPAGRRGDASLAKNRRPGGRLGRLRPERLGSPGPRSPRLRQMVRTLRHLPDQYQHPGGDPRADPAPERWIWRYRAIIFPMNRFPLSTPAYNGIGLFYDCLGTCRFASAAIPNCCCECFNAATGWTWSTLESLHPGSPDCQSAAGIQFEARHGCQSRTALRRATVPSRWTAPTKGSEHHGKMGLDGEKLLHADGLGS